MAKVSEDIVCLLLSSVKCLRVELGADFVLNSTKLTLNCFFPLFQNIATNLLSTKIPIHKSLEKVLEMLEVIVGEPGSSFRSVIGLTIQFLTQLYPLVSAKEASSRNVQLKRIVFRIFYNLLLSHINNLEKENEGNVVSILKLFLSSFNASKEEDMEIQKYNLKAMVEFNAKLFLFKKVYFKQQIYLPLSSGVLDLMLSKSRELVKDEMSTLLYELARLEFDVFYKNFLVPFLQSKPILAVHKKALFEQFGTPTDFPSFKSSLDTFIEDFSIYCGL